MTPLDREIAETLRPLIAKAETGEQWAEICRLEAEMIANADRICPACGVRLTAADTAPCDARECGARQ